MLIFNLGFTNNLFTFAEENNNIEIVTDTKIDTETYIPNIDITQNFSDDIVFVVIKTQYSDLHKVWTHEDFNIPNIKSIQHLTNFKFSNIEEEKTYLNSVTYRQILQIELEDKGKDKILNFINDIKAQNLNFILSANVYNLNLDLNSTLETTTDKCNLTSMHKNTKNCFENDNIPKLWSYTKTYDKDGFEIHGNKNIKAGIIEYAVVNNDNFINYNINNRINLTHFPDNKVTPGSHATAVAGILAGKYTGVASNITLYSYAIGEQAPEYKEKNYNFYTALNDSIADAIDKKIPVINISMGAWEDDDFNNYLAENYPGILVCSAGNACTNNDDLPHYPSDYTANNIISVANCTQLKENNSNWDRECDSEFKILNEIAELLGNNYDTKGSLQLYTQLYCCPSCFRVVKQFSNKYKNIDITIVYQQPRDK